MPAPTLRTEQELADFMRATIKEIADDLGWLDTTPISGDYNKPVHDVELTLGVSDIALSVEPSERIALEARVAIWLNVTEAYVRAYRLGGLSRDVHRNQLWDHAKAMLDEAQADLKSYNEAVTSVALGQQGGMPRSGSVPISIMW